MKTNNILDRKVLSKSLRFSIISLFTLASIFGATNSVFAVANPATSTPAMNAGTGADDSSVGTISWTTPGNITADDTNYATAVVTSSATSHYLKGTNYGFSIPVDATINGITVSINRKSSGNNNASPYLQDSVVKLVKGGSVVGSNLAATGTDWPNCTNANCLASATYGGVSNLWGTTWAAADINASDFGVVLSAVNANGVNSRTATVDFITITVTYSKTTPTLSLLNSTTTYNGSSQSVTVTSSVAGVISNVQYNGTTTIPTNVGTYAITADFTPTDTASYNTLTNASVGNYTINKVDLTVSATPNEKIYNNDTDATSIPVITSGSLQNTDTTNFIEVYDDKNVGIEKTLTPSGIVNDGNSGNNYNYNFVATTTGVITAKPLTVTAEGVSKIYDTTTTSTANLSSDRFNPDTVDLHYSIAEFADPNANQNILVTVSGISIDGTDAGNYSLVNETATTTANITTATGTIALNTIESREYNGSPYEATVSSTDPASLPYVITYDGSSTPPTNAGTYTVIASLTGNYAGNDIKTLTITPKNLTVSGVIASNRIYNATTTDDVDINEASLVGVIEADSENVSITGNPVGNFTDKNVGEGKTVNISGLSLSGSASDNYTFTPPTAITNISKATTSVSGILANNKTYDGNMSTTLDTDVQNFSGLFEGDSIEINQSEVVALFDNKNVGENKNVTVSGLGLGGTDAGNYNLEQPTGLTANITAKTATPFVTGENKVYDGNTSATSTVTSNDVLESDSVSLFGTATFNTPTVGNDKMVTATDIYMTGEDVGNYTLSTTTMFAMMPTAITKKELTVSGVSAENKVYDADTTATINTASSSLVGVINEDDVILASEELNSSFNNANVGNNKLVTITGFYLTGDEAGNYELIAPTTTANIIPVELSLYANDKSKYFGQDDPTLTYAYATSSGELIGDDLLMGVLTRVEGENVGTYAITKGNLSAGENYQINFATGTLTILNSIVIQNGEDGYRTTNNTNVSTTTNDITTNLFIPENTLVNGGEEWDGVVDLPRVTTTYTAPSPDSGFNSVNPVIALEMGNGDTPVTFNNPVRITFVGQAGKYVGWSRNGVFTPITNICNSVSEPTLAEGSDCKIDSEGNLIVWTKHFTIFVAYTQTPTPAPTPVISGGGGGWFSGGTIQTYFNPNTTTNVSSTTTLGTATSTPKGKVLGASTFVFLKDLKLGMRGNNDVIELQKLLIKEGFLKISAPTGYFGPLTKSALIKYQMKNKIYPASGFFGPITRAFINKLNTQ